MQHLLLYLNQFIPKDQYPKYNYHNITNTHTRKNNEASKTEFPRNLCSSPYTAFEQCKEKLIDNPKESSLGDPNDPKNPHYNYLQTFTKVVLRAKDLEKIEANTLYIGCTFQNIKIESEQDKYIENVCFDNCSFRGDLPKFATLKNCIFKNCRLQTLEPQSLNNAFFSGGHISKLKLSKFSDINEEAYNIAHLASLKELDLQDVQNPNIKCLKTMTSCSNLKKLNLNSPNITDRELDSLKFLPKLNSLKLNGAKITNSGLQSLRNCRNLQELDISNTLITDEGLEYLEKLSSLCSLSLCNLKITDNALNSIKQLQNLQELDLSYVSDITNRGLESLKNLHKLNTLGLAYTKISDRGLQTIKNFRNLQELNLNDTHVTSKGLKNLKYTPNLSTLLLNNTDITDKGLETLKCLKQLHILHISNTDITDNGIKFLKAHPALRDLNVNLTDISDQGLQYLQSLTSLEILDLSETEAITDQALKTLECLRKLQVLYIFGSSITDPGRNRLHKILPETEIE